MVPLPHQMSVNQRVQGQILPYYTKGIASVPRYAIARFNFAEVEHLKSGPAGEGLGANIT